MVPEFEEVRSHKGQAAGGVELHHLQVLLRHLPHGGAAPLEQSRVVEVPLWKAAHGGHKSAARTAGGSDEP